MTLMTNDLNDHPLFLSPLNLLFITPSSPLQPYFHFYVTMKKIFYHDKIITGTRGRGYGDTAEAPSNRLVPTTGRPLVL